MQLGRESKQVARGDAVAAEPEEPEIFSIQCLDDTVYGPTTGSDADDGPLPETKVWEPASSAASIPSTRSVASPHMPPHQQIQ
jgi:hypothetical protein